MPFADLDGQSVYFSLKKGDPALPIVVLLHGAGGSHLGWPPGLRRLSDFAVMGVDLPGHGRSTPPGRQGINDYANDIANLLQQQQTPPAILIGHSMGGAIAQTVAVEHPELAAGLILIATGAKLPVSDFILQQTLTDFAAVTQFITTYSWSPTALPPLVEKAHQELAKTTPQVLHGDFLACRQFDLTAQLAQITVPTLVIAGDSDKMTPLRLGQELANGIPRAVLYKVDKGSHMMMLEQMGEVTAVITQFLAKNI